MYDDIVACVSNLDEDAVLDSDGEQDECMNCGSTTWCHCAEYEAEDYRPVTELVCYICGEAHIDGTISGPVRKIVRTGISKGFDPTEWYLLDCGHKII
jgi:hypothetical protein